MAATDKTYRDQYQLDMVFALTSIAMLGSIILMMIQDYNREYKSEQRLFREVEVAVAQRGALDRLPNEAEFEEAKKEVAAAAQQKEAKESDLKTLRSEVAELLPQRDRLEQQFQAVKAKLESRISFYDIEIDHNGPESKTAQKYASDIQTYEQELAQ